MYIIGNQKIDSVKKRNKKVLNDNQNYSIDNHQLSKFDTFSYGPRVGGGGGGLVKGTFSL